MFPHDLQPSLAKGLEEIALQAWLVKESFGAEILRSELEGIENLECDLRKLLNRTHMDTT